MGLRKLVTRPSFDLTICLTAMKIHFSRKFWRGQPQFLRCRNIEDAIQMSLKNGWKQDEYLHEKARWYLGSSQFRKTVELEPVIQRTKTARPMLHENERLLMEMPNLPESSNVSIHIATRHWQDLGSSWRTENFMSSEWHIMHGANHEYDWSRNSLLSW